MIRTAPLPVGGTIDRMKTVLITGDADVPAPLRQIVEQGSTLLVERRAEDVARGPSLDADRIVFWAPAQDPVMQTLVQQYANAEAAGRREVVLLVTPQGGSSAVPALAPNDVYVWPRDEDRLKMAFLTGA